MGYYDVEFGQNFRRHLVPLFSALKMEATNISISLQVYTPNYMVSSRRITSCCSYNLLVLTRTFLTLLAYEFFLVISGTPPCLLALIKFLRLLDVFRPLTLCEKGRSL